MKKIPLRVWFVGIMGIVLLVVFVMLADRIVTNHSFVKAYDKEEYDMEKEEKLLTMNFPESYIPYYNLGNAAYKEGDYNGAAAYFTEALKQHPTKERDCQVRINLALSLCNTIDFYNLDTKEKVETALFILYKARDVLLENGCATNEGDGHNAEAQQLKEDIDKMIEMLENPQQQNSNNNQQQNSGDPDQNDDDASGNSQSPSDREKKIQKDLEENRKGALEDRKEQQGEHDKDAEGSGGYGDEENPDGGAGAKDYTEPW